MNRSHKHHRVAIAFAVMLALTAGLLAMFGSLARAEQVGVDAIEPKKKPPSGKKTKPRATASSTAKKSPPSKAASPLPPLRGFEFDTVTVNSSGSVTNRRKGQAQYFTEDINGVGLEMVEMPGDTFLMGSPDSEGVIVVAKGRSIR